MQTDTSAPRAYSVALTGGIASGKSTVAEAFHKHGARVFDADLIARDLVRRQDHALLVVRVDSDLVVLDSSNDLLMTDLEVQDYQPVMSFSGEQSWLHGYPQKPATIIASRDTPASSVVAR